MTNRFKFTGFKRFFCGLCLAALSSSVLAFVTDPFLMPDVGLIALGLYWMVTGLVFHKQPFSN